MKIKLLFKDSKWNLKNTILFLCFMVFINFNTNAQPHNIVDGGEISTTDNTTVCVGDGIPDIINVTLTGASGRVKQWIITDDEKKILDLPDSTGPNFLQYDFDNAPPGNCLIWHLSYNGIKPLIDPSGQEKFIENLDDLVGRYDLSDPIEIERIQQPKGGDLAIEGGATEIEICAGDGISDAFNVTLEGAEGPYMQWVITDANGNILGLPDNPPFDLEGAGEGVCLIWNLSYAENVSLEGVTNTDQLTGCFDLSNPIRVTRNGVNGGEIEIAGGGTEIEICAGDGVSDAFDVAVTGVEVGPTAWVITDPDGNILGLPAGPPFDLEGEGEGICLIWHLSFEDGLTGVEVGNNTADLVGCFDFSNAITVTRNGVDGGELTRTDGSEDPFTFTVGDGIPDNIPEDAITLTGNSGTNPQWVITDEAGTTILGLPPNSYTEPDFDGAGAGTCLVYHLSYEDGLEGLVEEGLVADLVGCYSFSNSVRLLGLAAAGRVAVYPNPGKTLVNVDLSGFASRNVNISVFSLHNVRVFDRNYSSRSLMRNSVRTIDVSRFVSGLYFVRVTNNLSGSSYIKRLVVN